MTVAIGAVEGGGTKFLAAVAERAVNGPPTVVDQIRVDTTDNPDDTLGPIAEWLGGFDFEALGIATFGPVDLATGRVRSTPKPGWTGADVLGGLTAELPDDLPTAFDTDVNGAGLGEWRWGAAQGVRVALYLTVGTGVGGGAIIQGRPLHGLGHPEMGHIRVPRFPGDDAPSTCLRHSDCLEGMVSGKALGARAGRGAEDVPAEDPLWDLAVHYLGHGLADLTLVLSPEVIVVGGGVMQTEGLLERVADRLDEVLGGYVDTPRVTLPVFGQEAGLYGALALAEHAAPGR